MNSYPIPIDHLKPKKFHDPEKTADGSPRATVGLQQLETLWINTGTLCNITCQNCYIESSPSNDHLAYITLAEVTDYLDEIARFRLGTKEIGLTGGEPFLNPEIMVIIEDCLSRKLKILVLTNAMKPMLQKQEQLVKLNELYGSQLSIRVSVDHYTQEHHEQERGPNTWRDMMTGLRWLSQNDFHVHVAGRTCWGEAESALRQGYTQLFQQYGIGINASDPGQLILFPEMDPQQDVPEITTECWELLNVSPDAMMCAHSRMVVKRKGTAQPAVLSCTLLPYDERFEMGRTLTEASRAVSLNHSYCAQFCVLGGGSCG